MSLPNGRYTQSVQELPSISKDRGAQVYMDSYKLHKQNSKPDLRSYLGQTQTYSSLILDSYPSNARRSMDGRKSQAKLEISDEDRGLIKAKHEKHQSIKEVYAIQSKILRLKMEEDRMLRKIENERRRAEELQRVRQSYDVKMMQLKMASFEKEQKQSEYYEQNQVMKQQNKQVIQDRTKEIIESKKSIHDEVIKEKQQLQKEKQRYVEGVSNQKMQTAMIIRQDLLYAKKRLTKLKEAKDVERVQSYIERVQQERKKKGKADKEIKQLSKVEQELLERVKKTQEIYKTVNPYRESRENSIMFLGPKSLRYSSPSGDQQL